MGVNIIFFFFHLAANRDDSSFSSWRKGGGGANEPREERKTWLVIFICNNYKQTNLSIEGKVNEFCDLIGHQNEMKAAAAINGALQENSTKMIAKMISIVEVIVIVGMIVIVEMIVIVGMIVIAETIVDAEMMTVVIDM